MSFRTLLIVSAALLLPFSAQSDEVEDEHRAAIAQCIQLLCEAPNSGPMQCMAEYHQCRGGDVACGGLQETCNDMISSCERDCAENPIGLLESNS